MKRFRFLSLLCLAALLGLLLTACGSSGTAPSDETDPPPAEESAAPGETQEPETPEESPETLAALLGEDYQTYLADTITMQMGNRMDKDPEVVYFPIQDGKPLTDYAAIDETTAFEVEEDGSILILLPAGSVADEAHGEQSFRIPKP